MSIRDTIIRQATKLGDMAQEMRAASDMAASRAAEARAQEIAYREEALVLSAAATSLRARAETIFA